MKRTLILVRHAKSSWDSPVSYTHLTLPTCSVAQFTFESKAWATIGSVKAEKVVLDYPKKE